MNDSVARIVNRANEEKGRTDGQTDGEERESAADAIA